MIVTIEPYEAIGPLRFGMSRDEVVAAIGNPKRVSNNRRGNPVLWYDWLNVIIEPDGLVEVGFGPEAPVSIGGMNPFSDPDTFINLCKLDGSPHEVLGFIVLQRLGITLTGFHDNDESQKSITAFARGRWDVLNSKMEPFPVPIATGLTAQPPPASKSP